MSKHSAGILLYRHDMPGVKVLLGHPGGPFWVRRDDGAWSIPKGEYDPDEDAFLAAKREFEEELGRPAPAGKPIDLGSATQPNGKIVCAWAIEADFDASHIQSNVFALEWPRKSGHFIEVPELDRAAWFTLSEAAKKLRPGQLPLLEALAAATGQTIQG